MPKYKILYHTAIEFNGHTIYRIEANRNFADVKAGDLGGYIESTENLSDEGDCWIYNDAIVCDSAKVKDNANNISSATYVGIKKIDKTRLPLSEREPCARLQPLQARCHPI